ncbi:protein TolR [Aquicella lusitana]|uniref:Tol-Pal system protein TolR n=1 Tax=Aquicella lusitana TaxID=254246 RepID=A0A370GIR6_9COXI|nr:protein TolR [Aquicella lusitana]RDI41823.1 cell division and transport-associated protein TolR [Aquicella lusitana]VVC73731.1 Biopolymer transport protein ExbD [Aquicella lusitana]
MAYTHQPGSRRPMSDINVVPFIDVMLVLLVIFMITAPLLTQGVKVDLPQTAAKALDEQQKEPLIVTVDASGNFYLNLADKPNQAIPAQTLSHLVTTQLAGQQTGEQRPVLVRGDKNANYGKVVEAMVLLQQAGAKSVGLITQPNSSDKTIG